MTEVPNVTFDKASHSQNANSPIEITESPIETTGLALAELCYTTILKDGFKACVACENKVVTEMFLDENKLINFINNLKEENAFNVNPIYVKTIEALNDK